MEKSWYLLVDDGAGQRPATQDELREFIDTAGQIAASGTWLMQPVGQPIPHIIEAES